MATNSGPGALAELTASRVLPLVVLDDASTAQPVGEALSAGGIHIVELAFRTPEAVAALRAMASNPALCVGAGTVLDVEQVDRAVEAGARFVVTPGLSAPVVNRCRELDVPVFPGVATASEIIEAVGLGLDVLKFFPAEALGGLRMISALAGPFPDTRFIPTGGVTAESVPAYLAHPSVLAVGGSWMVPGDLVTTRQWGRLEDLARVTTAAVRDAEVSA